ncbi:T9SS type A sorting domain-containing protein [Reichenbachiella sp.]|uniref:T9SS type A sorting domain-containing protein n=1 Tax=Reichenbachiella sp. TaxID=2184521 RepID=UPI003BB153D7
MKRYITILCLFSAEFCFGQTVHEVTVSIGQGVGCPVVAGIDHSPYFEVFPNPASTALTIQTKMEEAHFRLTDIQGRTVRFSQVQKNRTEIDIHGLPRGIYILHLQNGKTIDAVKVRIQ